MRRDRDRLAEDLGRYDRRRGVTLADDLDILLGDLCRLDGFCSPLSGAALLAGDPPLTAERFAMAVLVAEGFPDPHDEVTWSERFRRVFTYRYGREVLSAGEWDGA